jgi:inner membrane protein
MMGKSHVIFGTAAAAAYIYTVNTGAIPFADALMPTVAHPLVTAGLCILGSILPDIDHSLSTIGQKTYPLSYAIESRWGVRSYPHDPVLWALLALVCLKFPVMAGLFVGVASHLFLDGWNVMGIPVLFLFNKKRLHFMPFRALRVSAQSKKAAVLTWAFTFALILLAFPQARLAAGSVTTAMASFLKSMAQQ